MQSLVEASVMPCLKESGSQTFERMTTLISFNQISEVVQLFLGGGGGREGGVVCLLACFWISFICLVG